jgi:hypothetical protein
VLDDIEAAEHLARLAGDERRAFWCREIGLDDRHRRVAQPAPPDHDDVRLAGTSRTSVSCWSPDRRR